MAAVEKYINQLLGHAGAKLIRTHAMRDPVALMCRKAQEKGVGTILDIGANTGQYGRELRADGWTGDVVSFEPLSTAHQKLTAASAADPRWIIAPPMALGSAESTARINVSHNLASSSLLEVDDRSTMVAPQSGFASVEEIQVRPLDAVVVPEWRAPFAMKIDTQGFELEVLHGAAETLKRTAVVQVEMSLVPLYRGGPTISQLFDLLEAAGFRAVALTEGFSDLQRSEMLQVDGTFVREG